MRSSQKYVEIIYIYLHVGFSRRLLNTNEDSLACLSDFSPLKMVASAYISAARRLSPSVPKELEEYIASAYSSIRQEEAKSDTPHSYTTVRTLLSILRISAVRPI